MKPYTIVALYLDDHSGRVEYVKAECAADVVLPPHPDADKDGVAYVVVAVFAGWIDCPVEVAS